MGYSVPFSQPSGEGVTNWRPTGVPCTSPRDEEKPSVGQFHKIKFMGADTGQDVIRRAELAAIPAGEKNGCILLW